MKLRHIIITLVVLFVLSLIGIAYWAAEKFTEDEEPLDYSAMDIELGADDPAVNGYVQLFEISEVIEWDFGRLEEISDGGRIDLDPFYPMEESLSADDLRAILVVNQENIDLVQEALAMDVLQFYQPVTADTILPQLGLLQGYMQLGIIQARVMAQEGQPDEALALLIQQAEEIERLAQTGGGLVCFLMAAKFAENCNTEIIYLISHDDVSAGALRRAFEAYPLRGVFMDGLPLSVKYEFHFAINSIDQMRNDPEALGVNGVDMQSYQGALKFLLKEHSTKNTLYRNYLSAIEQLEHPAKEWDFGNIEELLENRPSPYLAILDGNFMGEVFYQILVPAMENVFLKAAGTDVYCEATYLTIAIRLYQLEHGALPPTLEALVPDYIDAVPTDPFDGEPIRYDAERAIVYSVGEDFVDNGGSELISRFDQDEPNFAELYDEESIAELDDTEPTYHLRFDQ